MSFITLVYAMKTDTLLELDLQLTNKTLTVYFESGNEKVMFQTLFYVCAIFLRINLKIHP